MEMAIINHPLVRAVNPDFPSDRYVKESHDKSIWYMIKGNIMYAPPVRALRANFSELERFSEAPPVAVDQSSFEGCYSVKLLVPKGTLAAYRSATEWKNFTNIEEF